jgi:hypothetical protein
MLARMLLLAAMTAAAISTAGAEEIDSRFTSMKSRACKTSPARTAEEGEVTVQCPGTGGYVVVLREIDIRQTVSVGESPRLALAEPAARTAFAPPNVADPTVEWRAVKGGRPFAIIMRWRTPTGEENKGERYGNQVLIVTRLPPGPVCHVAYVDARANQDANALAREAADDLARGFQCGKDTVRILGEPGASALLAGTKSE